MDLDDEELEATRRLHRYNERKKDFLVSPIYPKKSEKCSDNERKEEENGTN